MSPERLESGAAVLTLPNDDGSMPLQCQSRDQLAAAQPGPAHRGLVQRGSELVGLRDLVARSRRGHDRGVPLRLAGGTPAC